MRMTREKDKYECRFLGGCPAEDWIEEITDTHTSDWKECPCDNCPFMKYINYLAKLEDEAEVMEDDRK